MIKKMLTELDSWLVERNRRITLHVIGGYALELKNIQRGFQTEDIDSILKITEQDVVKKIQSIGMVYKNQQWFDFGAASLTAPSGYEQRLEKLNEYENIDLFVLSNIDLIKMKVAAYHSRRERGIYRDLEDLKHLSPTAEEISEATKFYYEEYSKDLTGKFKLEFEKDVATLKVELLGIFK
jgi:hypothetical protein